MIRLDQIRNFFPQALAESPVHQKYLLKEYLQLLILDFDCKGLSRDEFMEMTNSVLLFLQRSGWRVEIRDKPNDKLTSFRRNLYFPEFLYDLGLSGYKEERFLIKVESEDQHIDYKPVMVNIKGCGF